MKSGVDVQALAPGFDDPELGSEQTFRAIVAPMVHAGRHINIISKLSVTEQLNKASAAVCLTLLNHETPLWTDLRWNWPFPDPAAVNGTSEEKMQKVREIREVIKATLVETVEKGFS